jgi:hypothetical protein
MPAKTLHVRDEDAELWERAENAAKRTGASQSQFVVAALSHYLPTVDPEPPGEFKRIEVTVEREDGSSITMAFSGLWLAREFESTQERQGDDWWNWRYSVALTANKRFAVYAEHKSGLAQFNDYDDLDDAEEAGMPSDVLAAAAAALGQKRVVELVI